MHQTIKGITIMNEQILATGTDRNYAAALDWIKQAAASGKTLSLPGDEGPAQEDPVAALLPVITSEHATAIVAQQIRETLSAPRPAPAEGVAPADHGTFRYADPYSARCPDCGNPTGAAAEARKLLGALGGVSTIAVHLPANTPAQCRSAPRYAMTASVSAIYALSRAPAGAARARSGHCPDYLPNSSRSPEAEQRKPCICPASGAGLLARDTHRT